MEDAEDMDGYFRLLFLRRVFRARRHRRRVFRKRLDPFEELEDEAFGGIFRLPTFLVRSLCESCANPRTTPAAFRPDPQSGDQCKATYDSFVLFCACITFEQFQAKV